METIYLMKTTFKINFHFLFYIVSIICILTGLLKDFLMITYLIITHEAGHVLASLFFHWNIKSVTIYPFGGMTILEDDINRPLKEEFWIMIMGPIFQIMFFTILYYFIPSSLLKQYHYALLLFNLLPIYPLDGGKLLLILFHKFFSFSFTYTCIYFFSFLENFFFLFFVITEKLSFLFFFIFLILLKDIYTNFKQRKYLFHKFLLERYLYSYSFSKTKRIHGLKLQKMSKEKYHLFQTNEKVYFEEEILRKLFDSKEKM